MQVQTSPFNPGEPGFAENPFEQYERIRRGDRVQRTALGPLLVHRYRDCATLLRDQSTSVSAENATARFPALSAMSAVSAMNDRRLDLPAGDRPKVTGSQRLVVLDPPDHTRIRQLFSRTFTNSRVARLRGAIDTIVAKLLDGLAAAGDRGEPVDLVEHLSFPLPYQVIVELLGLPDGGPEVARWATTLATYFIEPLCTTDDAELVAAGEGMSAYLGDAIELRRRQPGDDLISAMVTIEDEGLRLSTSELLEQLTILFIAGHETTVNYLGNAVAALLRQRDQLERLVGDPSLDANAADEMLRWSGIQATRRFTLRDVDLGDGVVLPAGELVMLLVGAANRDPDHWGPTADRIDLGRPDAATHLTFGYGIHRCLGAALARLEGTVALPALVRRFPALELADDDPPWKPGRVVLRGVQRLPLVLKARVSR
jgi:cytochrome P450